MEHGNLVLYQVCVDRTGDAPFDGTGVQHGDKAQAIVHLKETQLAKPYAYLATVTYQRCDDEGHAPDQQRSDSSHDNFERIAAFTHHGMRATETLQALSNLLSQISPTEAQDPLKLAGDLVMAVRGMDAHLQTIHDAFDNIEIRTDLDETPASFATTECAIQRAPAMV